MTGSAAALAAVVALGAACGPHSAVAPDHLEAAKPGAAFDGVQCSAIRPPTEPDLMGWDSGSRARLKSLQESGVVAVRYRAEGCNVELEVLNCIGKGEYRFSPYSANETKVARSARELYAELPIGAARLGGKLAGGRALRTDYMLAGLLTMPARKSPAADLDPNGDCEQATHVVASVYLGGFAMAAGESETIAAGASLFGVGAGGGQDRSAESLPSCRFAPSRCARSRRTAGEAPPVPVARSRVATRPAPATAIAHAPQSSVQPDDRDLVVRDLGAVPSAQADGSRLKRSLDVAERLLAVAPHVRPTVLVKVGTSSSAVSGEAAQRARRRTAANKPAPPARARWSAGARPPVGTTRAALRGGRSPLRARAARSDQAPSSPLPSKAWMSARSCGRPAMRFICKRPSRDTHASVSSRHDTRTRSCHTPA